MEKPILEKKFNAINSNYAYNIEISGELMNTLKKLISKEYHEDIYDKAENINGAYLNEVKSSGKPFGNRDSAYKALYTASKYIRGMVHIEDILESTKEISGTYICNFNGMQTYILLKVLDILYDKKSTELEELTHAYKNHVVSQISQVEYISKNNELVIILNDIEEIIVSIRRNFNPKEISIAKEQFYKSNIRKIGEICSCRPK